MGRPKGSDNRAKERLLVAAGRGFRLGGFGGAGVDGLAKEAGLTSGAFYAHFDSKAEVFRLAMVEGLAFLRRGVETFRERFGRDWLRPFVEFYLGERLDADLTEACALPTFSADAARGDEQTRQAYEAELIRVIASVVDGLEGPDATARAWHLLSILSGAAGMARAVKDPATRAAIVASAITAASAV